MPEGDTIFRAATRIRQWVDGRTVTAARTKVRGLQLDRVVGKTIDEVEPRAKHLLIRFSNGLVLHTHMRMTGAWHLYETGTRWRKPEYQAKIVIECGERLIVCFNAPVVELLLPSEERTHRALTQLGPDVLGPAEFDEAEVLRRARRVEETTPLGDVLLDQRVVSGIGNIFRCESLFLDKLSPHRAVSSVDDETFLAVVRTARKLMKANIGSDSGGRRKFGAGSAGESWVYGRSGRPCRVCGTPIRWARTAGDIKTSTQQPRPSEQLRIVYWCPGCQPI